MKIEVTGVSISKKGTCWVQAKVIATEDSRAPEVGHIYDCKLNTKETLEEKNDEPTPS